MFQVQQPGDRAEGKGHHRIVLASLSGHWPDTDAGMEQRWELYFGKMYAFNAAVLTQTC